jgi:hypothetical protein
VGHQLSFYATSEDVTNMERAIRTLQPIVVLQSRSGTSSPKVVPHLTYLDEGKPWLFFCLACEVDLTAVITQRVAKQDYWAVDVLRSPVVEFQRGYHDDRSLRPGRVYYTDGLCDLDGTWFEKPAAFRSWAASVLRLIRRSTTKRGSAMSLR